VAQGAFTVYITSNKTATIANQPGGQQLEEILDYLSDSTIFVSPFFNADGSLSYEEYFNGNLCKFVTGVNQTICNNFGEGVAQRGLVAFNLYFATTLRSAKNYFDTSDQSVNAMITALNGNDVSELPLLSTFVSNPSYTQFTNATNNGITASLNSQNSILMVYMALFVIISVASPIIFGMEIYRKLANENHELKKLLKIFPPNVLLRNTYIKLFLINTSGGILEPIRTKL